MELFQTFIWGGFLLLFLYIFIAIFFFFYQERFIFYPLRLESDYKFNFPFEFDEYTYEMGKTARLNCVLAYTEKERKGVILYLHSNTGNIKTCSHEVIPDLLELGYDVFVMDYRSYGKSRGKISRQSLLYDVEFIYKEVKKKYPENQIHLFGKSLGAGLASYLASHHFPHQLIMETPFYSMRELAMHYFPWLPSFLLKYRLPTNKYCKDVEAPIPITIFHGTSDEIIPHDSSLKIKERVHHKINLYLIPKGRHNNLNSFKSYHYRLNQIL